MFELIFFVTKYSKTIFLELENPTKVCNQPEGLWTDWKWLENKISKPLFYNYKLVYSTGGAGFILHPLFTKHYESHTAQVIN